MPAYLHIHGFLLTALGFRWTLDLAWFYYNLRRAAPMISEVKKFNYTLMTCHRLWYDSTDPVHGIFTPPQYFRANGDIQTGKLNSQEHSYALE